MPFLGMRGTGDWVTDQRPEDYRQLMLYLYPNGMMPITGIMSKGKKEESKDPSINWWTKDLAAQAGAITDIFTDAAMTSSYTTGGVEDDILFVKVALATAEHIRKGHQVALRDSDHIDVDVNAKVLESLRNGADSRITVKLLEDDDNGATTDLSDADRILIIGNINPEGGFMPDAISYNPVKYNNLHAIARTPLSITRTARKTKLRTEDQYKESKREALEIHGIEMENQFFWSVKSESIGDNGKPERSMDGVRSFISKYASDNIDDYRYNTDFTGDSWLTSGEEWIDTQLEQLYKYGTQDKIGVCGSGTLLAINKLAKNSGNFELKARQKEYGIAVVDWVTPFGILPLKTHPLFSREVTTSNIMFILDMPNLIYRYIDDTFFKADDSERKGGHVGKDATDEEFLTEWSLELHEARGHGLLSGFGFANGLT